MIASEARHLLSVGATLGEGPVWVPGRNDGRLWFVDIKGQEVFRFAPASGSLDRWATPDQCGWVLPAASGAMIAGLKRGLERFDPADGSFTAILDPEPHLPDNRLNDATTDTRGRLWFGTMDDKEGARSGRLYRYDAGGLRDSGLAPVAITNGPAVSPDGTTLYHTDTLGKVIHAVPLNDDGTLGIAQEFARIEDGAGWPDGCVVDAAGRLWTGLFGGGGVRCYRADGKLLHTVALPVSNVTKIAFGGPDLMTAYVTTARKGLDAEALAAQPLAGDLFAFDVDVPGLPMTPIAHL